MRSFTRNRAKAFKRAIAAAVSVLLAFTVHAAPSTYTGTIKTVIAQPSPAVPATQSRISILTTTAITTACSATSAYSFDLSNAGTASVYEAILISAIAIGAQVTIQGSGTCDAYGIEEVANLQLS